MDPITSASLISAGGELLGGLAGLGANSKANYNSRLRYDQAAHLAQVNLIDQRNLETYRRDQDYLRQKEFATQGAGWELMNLMQAADQSGIHRLAAIGGAQGSGYSGALGGASANVPGIPNENPNDFGFMGDAVGKVADGIIRSEENRRRDRMANSEANLNEAQAELLRAQSRTITSGLRNAAIGGTAATSSSTQESGGKTKDEKIQEIYDSSQTQSGIPMATRESPDPEQDLWAMMRNGNLRNSLSKIFVNNLPLNKAQKDALNKLIDIGDANPSKRIAAAIHRLLTNRTRPGDENGPFYTD